MTTIRIKNMVCHRCIMAVAHVFQQNNIKPIQIELGEVQLEQPLTKQQQTEIENSLEEIGFELLNDQKKMVIEKIKTLLVKKAQKGDIEEHFTLSDFLTKEVFKDYSYISKLFSEVQGMTIEQFFILQKIEKVKEWLVYGDQSLNEIAFRLGYSSVQHLSSQFKKVTGMTPSAFKKIGSPMRHPIDQVRTKTK